MFFPRLRRRAKWVFLFIALAFGLSFVVAGVGSGFGSGIGDYLADIFNRQPSSGDLSSEEARSRVEKNPKDAEAQMALANALAAEGKPNEAIAALEKYTRAVPGDTRALQQLGSLYLTKAGEAERRAQAAQAEGAEAFFANEITDPQSELGRALGSEPITEFRQQQTSQAFSAAYTEAQSFYGKAADVWERMTKLEADDATFWFELGRSAQQAGDFRRAVKGYEGYLEREPEGAAAGQIRQIVKELRKRLRATGG